MSEDMSANTGARTRVAVAGVGKMGLSHLAILNAHRHVELAAICDPTAYLGDVLNKYCGFKPYTDFDRMLAAEDLDAVFLATPSKLHAAMVERALQKKLHVFCEKPFVLDVTDGERLVHMAEQAGVVNQVGYHYRFVAAFAEAARVVRSGALGRVHHVRAEAYGPVVLRPAGATWRSAATEGGGALYDYACHALDLVHCIVGVPERVSGVRLAEVFSRGVEDEAYCSLHFPGGGSGQLAVNWSDESYRKMSTRVSVWGENGRLVADRQECGVYLRSEHPALPGFGRGWTMRYTTDLTPEVDFYLRGEEYSAQVDHFIAAVREGTASTVNSFRSALDTDRVVSMIRAAADGIDAPVTRPRGRSWWARLRGRAG
jgi:predicted dehydrogenase